MSGAAYSSLITEKMAAMLVIRVRVQPGASKDEVQGWNGETLRVRLRARAVEGQANRALSEFLAKALGLRPYQVSLVRGDRSRDKRVEVDLPSAEELERRLRAAGALQGSGPAT